MDEKTKIYEKMRELKEQVSRTTMPQMELDLAALTDNLSQLIGNYTLNPPEDMIAYDHCVIGIKLLKSKKILLEVVEYFNNAKEWDPWDEDTITPEDEWGRE